MFHDQKIAPVSLPELTLGIGATFEDNHWRCDDGFCRLTGLSRAILEKNVQKAWGNTQIWLDIFASAIVMGIAAKVPVAALTGDWKVRTNAWLDAAYAEATVELNMPPAFSMFLQKGQVIADRVLQALFVSVTHTAVPVVKTGIATCEVCNKSYSTRLDTCPQCKEREREAQKAVERAEAEAMEAKWRGLTPAPLGGDGGAAPAWNEALEMKYCSGGSGGVYILRLSNGALCVKGSEWSAEELFAQQLAVALGIRVAASKVVHPGEEGKLIRHALREAKPAEPDHKLHLQDCIYKLRSVTILEYVDGVMMMGMPAHEHLRCSRGNADVSSTIFRELGRLMAYDTLINNFDRLPLAWSNDGNLGNVMLGSSLAAVVGIDQAVSAIKHTAGLTTYLNRIHKVVCGVRDGTSTVFKSVSESIHSNTAIELDGVELEQLRVGCLEFFTEVGCLVKSGDLETRLKVVSSHVSDVFERGLPFLLKAGIAPRPDPVPEMCDLVRKVATVVQGALDNADHTEGNSNVGDGIAVHTDGYPIEGGA